MTRHQLFILDVDRDGFSSTIVTSEQMTEAELEEKLLEVEAAAWAAAWEAE